MRWATSATALRELLGAYGSLDLFRLISYDSGACSLENADLVRANSLHYLFGLKGSARGARELGKGSLLTSGLRDGQAFRGGVPQCGTCLG